MNRFTLPAGWRLAPLASVAREKPNNGIFRKNSQYKTHRDDGVPVVWVEELFRGNAIDISSSRRLAATQKDVDQYGLKTGDLLFCRSSLKLDGIAYNNVYLGDDDAALFECHLIRISPKLDEVSPRFLNWLLRSPQLRAIAKSKSKTATMTTIDQESLGSILIPLPPLPEQRRIAAILDKADALRAKRRAALAQLDTLTQSIFLDVHQSAASLSRRMPLSDVAEPVRGSLVNGPFGSDLLTSELRDEGVPVVYIRDIRGGEYDRVSTSCITERKARDLAVCSVDPGDVLVAKVGDPPGVAAVYPETQPVAVVTQDVIRIRVSREVAIPEFIAAYLNAPVGRWKVAGITIEATRARFSLRDFKALEIEVPPVALQRDFARQCRTANQLKAAHRASLTELDALFASLQHRAFRGEL